MGPDALSRVCEIPSSHAVPCLSITSHHLSTLPHSLEEIAKVQGMDNTITHLPKNNPSLLKTTKECGTAKFL